MLKSSEATLLPPSSSLRFRLENQINRNACNDAEDYGKRLSLIALLEMIHEALVHAKYHCTFQSVSVIIGTTYTLHHGWSATVIGDFC